MLEGAMTKELPGDQIVESIVDNVPQNGASAYVPSQGKPLEVDCDALEDLEVQICNVLSMNRTYCITRSKMAFRSAMQGPHMEPFAQSTEAEIG